MNSDEYVKQVISDIIKIKFEIIKIYRCTDFYFKTKALYVLTQLLLLILFHYLWDIVKSQQLIPNQSSVIVAADIKVLIS